MVKVEHLLTRDGLVLAKRQLHLMRMRKGSGRRSGGLCTKKLGARV